VAARLKALLRLNDAVEVIAPRDCYFETRELIASLGSRIRVLPSMPYRWAALSNTAGARILWLDSSVRRSFSSSLDSIIPKVDLVVLDTTCFWRGSNKIGRVIQRAMRMGIPMALVRSHGKLDS